MLTLTSEEQAWLDAYCRTVASRFGDLVEETIVFGSKARGDATEDSDLDILIVIREGDWSVKDAVTEPGYTSSVGSAVVPSFMVLTRQEWDQDARERAPFWRTVTRDGVAVT